MEGNPRLAAALNYLKSGYCVIPVKADKRPYIQWAEFQQRHPDMDEVYDWWEKWPSAGVAIVTGTISGLCVVDIDMKNGKDGVSSLRKVMPAYDPLNSHVKTQNNGYHLYYSQTDPRPTAPDFLDGVDFKADGGYVVATPSIGYTSVLALKERGHLDPLPDSIIDILQSLTGFNYLRAPARINSGENPVTNPLHNCDTGVFPVTSRDTFSGEGTRDHELFHVANCLVRGGMDEDRIRKCVYIYAQHCDPPFSMRDAETKIKSAINRSTKKTNSTTDEIRMWALAQDGEFSVTSCYNELQAVTKADKGLVRQALKRMVDSKEIERSGNRSGWYRRPELESPEIDVFSDDTQPLDIVYPLRVEEYFRTMPKNLIVIAGTQDAGKTAYMLRFAAMNHNRIGMPIRYMSSEMGAAELKNRLQGFDDIPDLNFWKGVDFREVSSNFADRIHPNAINIIDYLEVSDNFYMVAGTMRTIYEKLDQGICLIAIQKDFKNDLGRGGSFSLEKPRLYLSISSNYPDGNIAKIVKCKNWRKSDVNPNNRECCFTVWNGNKFQQVGGWRRKEKQ